MCRSDILTQSFKNNMCQMDNIILNKIHWLQLHYSSEALTVVLFVICALAILKLLRAYGLLGLYVYNCLAIIFANIQVLRVAQYEYFSEPVALGTVLFTTTFFVNDLITEHYGLENAKKSVKLGFFVQVLTAIWMVVAMSHPQAAGVTDQNYQAMLQLFTPAPRILIASLLSYFCSQWLDVILFNKLRDATQGKSLWLRQNLAMFTSGLFDNFLFSALAWIWLSPMPVTWSNLFFTYILSAQIIRSILNVAFTPLIYMSYKCLPKNNKNLILAY